jgi:hypothetical protein
MLSVTLCEEKGQGLIMLSRECTECLEVLIEGDIICIG